MAIRLTIDGIRIECDTPQEVASLLRATKPADKHLSPRPQVQPEKVHNQALFQTDSPKFKGDHLEMLSAMKEAFPNDISSELIAARIGKTLKSIPIILVGLKEYAKKQGAKPGDIIIVRTKPPKGEKGSSYRLTEKGLKVFFG